MFYHWGRVMHRAILLISFQLGNPHKVEDGLPIYFSEDCVFFVEPGALVDCHEKLRFIHIDLARICHCDDSSSAKLESLMELI
jgi:hypothetical protein